MRNSGTFGKKRMAAVAAAAVVLGTVSLGVANASQGSDDRTGTTSVRPAADDHGGLRQSTDDPPGDDHGGLRQGQGQGQGRGTDDPPGDDHGADRHGDRHGGHGSDDPPGDDHGDR